MTIAERGLLLSMWNECWVNKEIPADANELAAWLGKPILDIQSALTPNVLAFFERKSDGTFISPDLEDYRKNVLDKRERMAEGGSRGGKKRVENERKLREASSPPSSLPSDANQTTLKPSELEPEFESEPEPEPQSLEKNTIKDPFVENYEAYEARERLEYARVKDGY